MKKVLLVALVALMVTLSGCTTELETSLTELEAKLASLETTIEAQEKEIDNLEVELGEKSEEITGLESLNAELDSVIKTTNSRIKNALNRDNWASRKVKYNADYSSYDAEYCFGIFDENWTLENPSDYTHNTGLKFVITVEQLMWGTEMFVKDSCGNYSEFIYDDSSYSMYSIPAGFFTEGETYEVVLYKDVYFTVNQLGLLPVSEMEAFGAYPADLSGIEFTKLD